jgi:1,4-dihydroxy-2-naphthoate polyprenyltransferase
MPTLKQYIIATRPWSFSMSVISVLMGTLVASERGDLRSIQWGWFAVVAVGIVLMHAGGNVLNDYFDSKNEVDRPDSPTALYRPHPIMAGMMSLRTLLLEGLLFVALAGLCGLALAVFRTPHVYWVCAAGLLLAFTYTGWPFAYKYRALGEIGIFAVWGPLMFLGAYAVQKQALSWKPVVASVPFGILVALVLFANNMRDIEHDTRSGVKTLGTFLGVRGSLYAYAAFMLSAYLYVGVAVILGLFSPWLLVVLLSLPMAVGLLRGFVKKGIPEAADAITAKLDTAFGILFVAGLVLDWTLTK